MSPNTRFENLPQASFEEKTVQLKSSHESYRCGIRFEISQILKTSTMKQRNHTLLTALFIAVCFITSSAYSQSTNSGTPKEQPAYGHGTPDGDAMPDFGNLASSPDGFIAKHPRFAKAWKFLNNASFRAGIEKPMTAGDKETIENAVTEIKSDIKTLKALKPEFKAARDSGDADQLHALFETGWPSIKQLIQDRKTILAIIAKYKDANTSSGQLLDPVYPNPITIGSTAATVSYHLKNDGPVNITVTDASGNIVKQISNVSESAGDHTITVGPEAISKPGTYYVTVEADNTKSTQKVAAVQ